ncbi:SDR family oxidoreductase [uncultured Roseobacter sp.]|uniref:SDR family oxidoreductase n=1 Tax=uncultured Roseobacter sp. TaxID=114847 RepID=UPI002629A800|nr:SDR family oxidoreductase [uncultured Roseobacter sp.]
MNFYEKTVVITGASRGIGAATAEHFAAAGAHVVLAARRPRETAQLAERIKDAGGVAEAVTCDVSRYDDVAALARHAQSVNGRTDLWISNAGLIDPIARIADSDPSAWSYVADVNLKGVYFGLRAALPGMINAGGGTFVHISSGAATSALEGWSHYCATKAAVLSLTRVADREYRDKGIRVIGLSPGTVATAMQKTISASGINPVSKLDWSAHITPQDVARAVAWAANPAADAWLGQDFSLKSAEGRAIAGLPPL